MRIRNILLAAVVALFLTAPAPARAVGYEAGQAHGPAAACLEDNGTYKAAPGSITGGMWTIAGAANESPAPGRQDASPGGETQQSETGGGRGSEYYQIFPPGRWEIVMFWYNALTILSGGFLAAVVVRSGYRYMLSASNPGLKASFVEDLQRCIVAMAVMALAPVFMKLIIGINDAFVVFFADIVNHITAGRQGAMQTAALSPAGLFETVITAPLHIILALLNEVFGLDTINELVFNNRVEVVANFNTPHTGNVFADVLLDLSMAGFNIYFNAFYTIRRWVVTIAFTATPIIVWIWALTAERQVLEIWLAEIFQTVFVQSAHALVLGTYLSILFATGTSGVIDGTWLTHGLAEIALWIAGCGGAVCVLVIVFAGYRIVTAEGEQEAAQAKESLKKALTGLVILGLALTIAGFLAATLAGRWS